MVGLALVWGATAVPEEEPLQGLVAFELILESEMVVLVRKLQQVEQLRGRLHDRERRRLGVVYKDRDAAFRETSISDGTMVVSYQNGRGIPLGFRRRNQSFFCSLSLMLIRVVVHWVV